MEILNQILENSSLPVVIALVLGLMTAISPCPLATNITAIAYIGKNLGDKKKVFINGILYTLGRAITYVSIGLVLFFGASTFRIGSFFQSNGERYLGPLLLIIGILMLDFIYIRFPGLGSITRRFEKANNTGSGWSAILMGIVFALAFCPLTATLYFSMLIPLTISSASGLYLPLVYAIATGLPVIVFAWLIAYTLSGVGLLYSRLKTFELWFRRLVAIVFIIVGARYIYIYYF